MSDSHSGLSFMRRCVDSILPDAMIHLGDYFDDGETIAEEYPNIPMYQVPGNCDMYRCSPFQKEILLETIGGVRIYMTHGHRHGVKMNTAALLADGRKAAAAVVLYGHTHSPEANKQADGVWLMNPGACGSYGGTVGLIEIEDKKVVKCKILYRMDLEDYHDTGSRYRKL